jgi:hypothetical protein
MASSTRRLISARTLWSALAAAAILCLAAPLAAGAATTRYASPTGTGASPCLKTAPCLIETALSTAGPEGLANGDTVLLGPGTYTPTGNLEIFRKVTVSGEPGVPTPEIEAGGEFGLMVWERSTVRDLRIKSPATTSVGIAALAPGTVLERIESVGEAATACSLVGVIRDSLCIGTSSGGTGAGIYEAGSVAESFEASLVNVTAIGGYAGIDAGANQKSTVTLNATNTIASGGEADVAVIANAATSPVTVNLSHSNFATEIAEGPGPISITSPAAAGNQTAPPLFVDKAAGNYAEQATSPTRLTGDLAAVQAGETDLAGNPRSTNCAGTIGVDIGAYQYECPTPPVGNSTVTVIKPPPLVGPPTAPSTPRLSKLALKPAKFTDTGKAPKGTTISYTLAAAAKVKLEVLGKKTVKGKARTVTLGTVPGATGKAGANTVKFSGKLKGKALAPGKYTLRATATASGLSSTPATAGFEVLIP